MSFALIFDSDISDALLLSLILRILWHYQIGPCYLLSFYQIIGDQGANLINVLEAFFKPACVLIFSGVFCESCKKFKHLEFLPGAQKKLPALRHPMA